MGYKGDRSPERLAELKAKWEQFHNRTTFIGEGNPIVRNLEEVFQQEQVNYDTKLHMAMTSNWLYKHILKDKSKFLCGRVNNNNMLMQESVNEVKNTLANGKVCKSCLKKLDSMIAEQRNLSFDIE